MRHLVLALTFLFCTNSFSQSFEVNSLIENFNKNGQIQGKVLDFTAEKEPLAFATIQIKNSNISTKTALNGTFLLNIKPGTYNLVFTFIGYKSIEVKNVVVNSASTTTCNQIMHALVIEPTLVVSRIK